MTYGDLSLFFPYNSCNTTELTSINSTDRYFYNEQPNIIPKNYQHSTIQYNTDLYDNDLDLNVSNVTDCKYYSVDEFQKIKSNKSFNIFHNNVNGLETKFDHLQHFFANSFLDLDIIAITEISQQEYNGEFKTKIKLNDYDNFSTPTYSEKGGALLYTKKDIDAIERVDLNQINAHFESVWVEIKNKNGKNVICGSIYRHPHDTNDIFNNFLKELEFNLTKITK